MGVVNLIEKIPPSFPANSPTNLHLDISTGIKLMNAWAQKQLS